MRFNLKEISSYPETFKHRAINNSVPTLTDHMVTISYRHEPRYDCAWSTLKGSAMDGREPEKRVFGAEPVFNGTAIS